MFLKNKKFCLGITFFILCLGLESGPVYSSIHYLRLKTTTWAGFVWAGLKLVFYLEVQSLALVKSELKWEWDCATLLTMENKDMSSAKSFKFKSKLSFRSFMFEKRS